MGWIQIGVFLRNTELKRNQKFNKWKVFRVVLQEVFLTQDNFKGSAVLYNTVLTTLILIIPSGLEDSQMKVSLIRYIQRSAHLIPSMLTPTDPLFGKRIKFV